MMETGRPKTFLERGGTWVVGQSVLMLGLVAAGPLGRGAGWIAWSFFAGAILFGVGAWLGVSGVRVLGRSRTPFPVPVDRVVLVDTGVYSRVRHPLYGALMLAGFGWGFLFQSWIAIAFAAALGVFLGFKARFEERQLIGVVHGYEAYMKKVPRRFFPL